MKRQKPRSFSPSSFQGEIKSKKGKTLYVCDKKLLPRLRQFLSGYGKGKQPSLDEAVDHLQEKYGEYNRKKKTAFRASVQKVYKIIKKESAEEIKLQELEERFLGKRRDSEDFLSLSKEDDIDNGLVISSDSECTEDETRPDSLNRNLVNESMHEMYKTSNSKQNSEDEDEANLDIDMDNNTATPQKEVLSDNKSNYLNVNLSSVHGDISYVQDSITRNEGVPLNDNIFKNDGISRIDNISMNDNISKNANISKNDDISKNGNISKNDNIYKNDNISKNDDTSNSKIISKNDNYSNTNDLPRIDANYGNNAKHSMDSSAVRNRTDTSFGNNTVETPLSELGMSSGQKNSRRKKLRRSEETRNKRSEDLLKNDEDRMPSVPTLQFSDVGGCGDCIQEVCKLLIHIKHPEVFKTLGITPPRGFLLHGPPGCGKTLLAHAIAGELGVALVNVASTEMVSGVSGESEGKIRDLFTRAQAHAPCVLFLDEIDAITPKRETASKEMERRIVAQLLSCLDELNSNKNAQVVVIGATNRPDSLDPALRRAGRFDREIRMGIPDEHAREQILRVQCKDLKLNGEFDFKTLAQQTPGFVGADLMALAREAAMCAVTRIFHSISKAKNESLSLDETENSIDDKKRPEEYHSNIMAWLKSSQTCFTEEQLNDLSIEMSDFTSALQEVQPSAKREGFATIPDVTWDDIGALEDIREELTMAIIAPVRHRQAFAELGLTNPPGILLAGPPGCGKTLLAKAIANESGINFISVKGPELLNMYVGESERAVRQVFQRARNSAPCVIFFDELDALCPRRSDSAESNASARVVNQLLTEMDGLETRKQVFIMGATNRPDIIDPAILRPGRLDKVLYVGLPGEADRLAILRTLTKNGTKPRLLEDVDLTSIAADDRCHGYSGADLAALVREASVNALRECMKTTNVVPSPLTTTAESGMTWEAKEKPLEHSGHVGVSMKHFDLAFGKIKPSVSEKEQLIYRYMR